VTTIPASQPLPAGRGWLGGAQQSMQPASQVGMGEVECFAGPLRGHGAEHIDGVCRWQTSDQFGQLAGIEAVQCGRAGGQLHGMAPGRGQVEIGPGHHMLGQMVGTAPQAEAAHEGGGPHLDAHRYEVAIPRFDDDVADPIDPVAHDVDDLGIEYVATQQNFVLEERAGRGDGAEQAYGSAAGPMVTDRRGVDQVPGHQSARRARPEDDTLDGLACLDPRFEGAEADGEIT